MLTILNTNDISISKCHAKNAIGIIFTDDNGDLVNGTKEMSDGSIMRFKNGMLDGDGLPAIEYESGGTEYWKNGLPDGQPAIITDFGTHEEDWIQGVLVQIRDEYELNGVVNE